MTAWESTSTCPTGAGRAAVLASAITKMETSFTNPLRRVRTSRNTSTSGPEAPANTKAQVAAARTRTQSLTDTLSGGDSGQSNCVDPVWPTATADGPSLRSSRKVAFASLIGTTIEWYDFFIFGTAAALVFNEVFFPSFDPVTGTLAAFASFSVGFIARPFGGAVFAHYGDKIGRKPMLVYSLLLMGAATVLMGLLPGYASIGIWAPTSARHAALRSGLRRRRRVGWCGADGRRARSRASARLLRRLAPGRRAGGIVLGTGTYALLSATLTDEQFLAMGMARSHSWPARCSSPLGMWIRLTVTESPIFQTTLDARSTR